MINHTVESLEDSTGKMQAQETVCGEYKTCFPSCFERNSEQEAFPTPCSSFGKK
jgi:hypothetical protein